MNYTSTLQRILGIVLLIVLAFTAADLTAAALDRRLQVEPEQLQAERPVPAPVPGTGAGAAEILTALKTSAPEKPVGPTGPDGEAGPDAPPPPSITNLKLKGTLAGGGLALAVIETAEGTRALGVGEQIGGFTVTQVGQFSAELRQGSQTATLTMEFGPDSGPATGPTRKPTEPPKVIPGPPQQTTSSRLTAEELRGMLDNPESYEGKFRLTGVQRDGDTVGMLVQFTSGDNPLARLGLRHGDIVMSLNGKPLRSVEDLNEAYRMLRNSTSLTFTVERGGRPMPIQVSLEE